MSLLKKKIVIKKKNFIQKQIYLEEYNNDNNSTSIHDLIEKKDKFIRKEIIEILNNISKKNKDLLKTLEIYDDFNFWELTNFQEKNLYKKNNYFTIAKIISLLDYLKEQEFDSIEIYDENKKIKKLLEKNFPKKKIIYQEISNKSFIKKIGFSFHYEIYSILISFIFILRKFFFKKINKFNIETNKNLFLSFFTYLDEKKLNQNIYRSSFWGDISTISQSNFLHFFIKNKQVPNINVAQDKISKFKDSNIHMLLDNFCKIIVIKNMIKFLIKIKFESYKLKKKIKIEYKNLDLSFFFTEDINREFLSYNIIIKLYFFFAFEYFFKKYKFQKNCFFTMENQPWEKSLIYHWKNNNNKKIFGVINSLVRFWDLRFSRSNYLPSKILANGSYSFNNLKEFGYEEDVLEIVESLRYENSTLVTTNNNSKNILILFDYSESSNERLIEVLNSIQSLKKFGIFAKFHNLGKVKKGLLRINYEDYNKNINDFRFVICANKTSAAVDFYRQGYKIITIKDFNEFNLSPLKNYEECLFVSNSKEIDDYLNSNYEHMGLRHKNDKFYLINKELLNWKKILND